MTSRGERSMNLLPAAWVIAIVDLGLPKDGSCGVIISLRLTLSVLIPNYAGIGDSFNCEIPEVRSFFCYSRSA